MQSQVPLRLGHFKRTKNDKDKGHRHDEERGERLNDAVSFREFVSEQLNRAQRQHATHLHHAKPHEIIRVLIRGETHQVALPEFVPSFHGVLDDPHHDAVKPDRVREHGDKGERE